tara:strand:- start:617 stop:1054 length:438 start_codon:yes stop_codon:yes gene_type:complete
MIEALQFIRKAIITRLTGQITAGGGTVPIYNRVPSNATEPFIKVYSISNDEVDQNQTSFTMDCVTGIEVVTSFDADDGGELQSNQIVSSVLNLVRTRSAGYYDLSSDGFNVYTCTNEGINYIEEDAEDKTYFRAVIQISNRVQKT